MKDCKNCKHYKRSERIGIKVCEFGLHESYCEKDKEDFAIEELEKIREELHETAEMHSNGNYYLRDEWIDEYIDKHISELKGE